MQELERADDGRRPIAEIWRRVGAEAERRGTLRPSYERVRTLVQARRARRPTVTTGQVVLDVVFRARPPDAIVKHLAGI